MKPSNPYYFPKAQTQDRAIVPFRESERAARNSHVDISTLPHQDAADVPVAPARHHAAPSLELSAAQASLSPSYRAKTSAYTRICTNERA